MIYLTLIPLFAVLDRWCGGGMGWRSTFRGRPIYYVALLIPLAFVFRWQLGAALTAWCLWRWPSWKLLGGSLTPSGSSEVTGTFFRHLLILPVMFAFAQSSHEVMATKLALLVLWAVWATVLAVHNRVKADRGDDVNWAVELARGFGFGIVIQGVL